MNKFSISTILITVTAIGFTFQFSGKGCQSPSNKKGLGTIGLQLLIDIPLMSLDTVAQHRDTFYYYQKDRLIVYKMPVSLFQSKIYYSSDGEITGDSLLRIGKRYEYYVYHQNKKYGIKFDSITSQIGTIFSVDSLLERQTITNFDRFYIAKIPNDSLIEKGWSKDKKQYIEKYVPRRKVDETYSDSTVLTFSGTLDRYFFSLSPYLEKSRQIKLESFKLIYTGQSKSSIRSYHIPRYLMYEAKSMPSVDNADVEIILSRFAANQTLLSGQ